MDLLDTFFTDVAACERFVTRLKQAGRATESGECIGMPQKEARDRWSFTLAAEDGRHVGDYLVPFAATAENVETFNRGVRDLGQRLLIYLETDDASRVPQQPPPFAELTHIDGLAPEWVQSDTFGQSRTYIDRAGLVVRESGVVAWVRYELHPPGLDKLTGQPIAEMWNCEEHDLAGRRFRLHRMAFMYVDGTRGEPGRPVPEWRPATGGHVLTQAFLQRATAQ